MIVCICHVVSDQDIKRVIASGAHSVAQVGRHCGAGTGCGACREHVGSMLEQARVSCPGSNCHDCSSGARSSQDAA